MASTMAVEHGQWADSAPSARVRIVNVIHAALVNNGVLSFPRDAPVVLGGSDVSSVTAVCAAAAHSDSWDDLYDEPLRATPPPAARSTPLNAHTEQDPADARNEAERYLAAVCARLGDTAVTLVRVSDEVLETLVGRSAHALRDTGVHQALYDCVRLVCAQLSEYAWQELAREQDAQPLTGLPLWTWLHNRTLLFVQRSAAALNADDDDDDDASAALVGALELVNATMLEYKRTATSTRKRRAASPSWGSRAAKSAAATAPASASAPTAVVA